MTFKNLFLHLFIISVIVGIILFLSYHSNQEKTFPPILTSPTKLLQTITFTVRPNFIYPALAKYPAPTTTTSSSIKIKGVIVPHHDLASNLIAEALQKVAETERPKRIILIGPNHPDLGNANVLTTKAVWSMGEIRVSPDEEVLQELIDHHIADTDDNILAHEHSIYTILPFIHTYFPNAKIVPLILNSRLHASGSLALAEELQKYIDDQTLIIASIDFSHYLPSDEDPIKDAYTKEVLLNRDYEKIASLNNDYTDSPSSLIMILKTMELSGAASTTILRNSNSGLIIGRPIYSSTSYFTILFSL
jgi:AmmeMemoRadiSam system protein B